jgi:UDP-glucose 4-epimerase
LRLGMFVAASDFELYGFRLLSGGVDERDVATAFLLALENERIGFDAFSIVSDVPFTSGDEKELVVNPRKVLEKYYPGSNDLFQQKAINVEERMKMWGRIYWSNEKAKNELGFHPQYNFDGFLAALKEGNTEYYPYAGLPWWGV